MEIVIELWQIIKYLIAIIVGISCWVFKNKFQIVSSELDSHRRAIAQNSRECIARNEKLEDRITQNADKIKEVYVTRATIKEFMNQLGRRIDSIEKNLSEKIDLLVKTKD